MPAKTVAVAGEVPAYRIQKSDIGKVITLIVTYAESDGNGYGTESPQFTKTTDGFETGIVLELER